MGHWLGYYWLLIYQSCLNYKASLGTPNGRVWRASELMVNIVRRWKSDEPGKGIKTLHLVPYALPVPPCCSWAIFFYKNQVNKYEKSVSFISVSRSSQWLKLRRSWEPLIYSLSVRSADGNLHLELASEVEALWDWALHLCDLMFLSGS